MKLFLVVLSVFIMEATADATDRTGCPGVTGSSPPCIFPFPGNGPFDYGFTWGACIPNYQMGYNECATSISGGVVKAKTICSSSCPVSYCPQAFPNQGEYCCATPVSKNTPCPAGTTSKTQNANGSWTCCINSPLNG